MSDLLGVSHGCHGHKGDKFDADHSIMGGDDEIRVPGKGKSQLLEQVRGLTERRAGVGCEPQND